ncbi:MAG: NADPH-dependent FMN reductase [Leptothrix sp. (in: b-proteobacteria)]
MLLVAGSLRRGSWNGALLDDFSQRLSFEQGDACAIDRLTPADGRLPLFDEDLEADSAVMAQVAALHRRFAACDGLVIASPECNGQLSAYLKNLIDWVSRLMQADATFANPFLDRPVLLCSATTGTSGGAVAIPHARAWFGHVGALAIGDAVCVAQADRAWTGDGDAFAPWLDAQIDAALQRVHRLASQFAHASRHP